MRTDHVGSTDSGEQHQRYDEHLRSVEHALGLQPNALISIIRDGDDWSVAIKSAALVESSLNSILRNGLPLGRHAAKWVEKHPAQGPTGKLELAKSLDLITTDASKVAKRIFAIRNAYAHRIENLSRSMVDIYEGLDNSHKFPLFDDFILEVDALKEFPKPVRFRLAIAIELSMFMTNRNIVKAVEKS